MSTKPNDKKTRKETFDACMKMLAGGFRVAFDNAAMDAYWIAVGDLDPSRMRGAFERAIREETAHFPPSPGKIRACALPTRVALPPEKPFTPPTAEEQKDIHAEIQALRRRIADNIATEEREAESFAKRWAVRS